MVKVDLNSFEVRFIQKHWEIKSLEFIANMLDKPLAEIRRIVDEMQKTQKAKLYQRPVITRVLKNKEKEASWAKKQLDKKTMHIRQIDESQLITVRLDAKTIVKVKPGTDIEALKKRLYSNRILKI